MLRFLVPRRPASNFCCQITPRTTHVTIPAHWNYRVTTPPILDDSSIPLSDRDNWLRLVDANVNRAAEGLRTIEDICRLVWEDRVAAQRCKELRHQLTEVCRAIPRHERLSARSAATDAGSQTTLDSEQLRVSLDDVVTAAAERTTQSLRNLEEFAKLHSTAFALNCKQLRYVAYDALATIELRLNSKLAAITGRIILLIDCTRDLESFANYLQELAAAGVDYFQLRDKTADGSKLLLYARTALESLNGTPSRLFINDRVDLALASGAYGVHVGQDDLSLADVRRLSRGKLRIGVSTHNLKQAIAAEREGADYIGCGPTFPSDTKQFEAFAGVKFIREVAEAISIPAFAIGGVDQANISQVIQAGMWRIAVSGAVHRAADPIAAARELQKHLQNAPS